jgi:hypothetical protein
MSKQTLNENPAVIATAARMAIQNADGKKVSVNTARQTNYASKDPSAHKKAKSIFQRIKDKISKKKDKPKKDKPMSKKDSDFYARQYGGKVEAISALIEKNVPTDASKWSYYKGQAKKKFDVYPSAYANAWAAKKYKAAGGGWKKESVELEEGTKIQVQGLGMYDDKTLKKKIIQLSTDLQKNAKKGDWSKASENGIRALGRMWKAYQDWSRNNESVNEAGTKSIDGEELMNFLMKRFKYSKKKAIDVMKKHKMDTSFLKNESVKESKTSNMMKAIRKHGTAGPWSIIVSKNNKVVSRVSVKMLKEIPAYLAALRPRYPNHKIGIEAKSGKIAYREQVLNERVKTAFMVHPKDPDKTETHWVKVFNELAQGHPSPIDYGPRETHMYDWNDRRNYDLAIDEYNKMMNKIANGLNKSLDQMNNIWKEWDKIYKKYLKKDGRK